MWPPLVQERRHRHDRRRFEEGAGGDLYLRLSRKRDELEEERRRVIRRESDRRGVDVRASTLLALNLLDLRAQYEAELRALATMQRYLDNWRAPASPGARTQAMAGMRQQWRTLREAQASIQDALSHIEETLTKLE